jgi:sialic acid synthase SpsE
MSNTINIADRTIGINHPTYFVADIGSNADGDLDRAKDLIHLANDSGADAVKFQNFRVDHIVSDYGFAALGSQISHQSSWQQSVFEVYRTNSLPFDWTPVLAETAAELGIHYFSSPYDYEAIDHLKPYVPAYKAGSGLLSWPQALEYMASQDLPVLIATGASELGEITRVVRRLLEINSELVLMQCNTNYTGLPAVFDHLHLNVLKTYGTLFPDLVLGLSDHSPGHSAVLGAVALGARVIEKHFTDDNNRVGPDHSFAMDPDAWRNMVDRTRELERALGSTDKFVTDNEVETVVIQRRCLRASRSLTKGDILTDDRISILRPAAPGAVTAKDIDEVIGAELLVDIPEGAAIHWGSFLKS